MNDEKRCRGCGRWPRIAQVEGAIDECNQPQNANVLRCAWRKQQVILSQQSTAAPVAPDEAPESPDPGEPLERTEPPKVGEPPEHVEARAHAEPSEQAEVHGHKEPPEHAEGRRRVEPPGHTEVHGHQEPPEHTEARGHAESPEHAEARQHTGSSKPPSAVESTSLDATIVSPTPTGSPPPAEPTEPHPAVRLYEKLAERLKSVEAERERIVQYLQSEIAKHKQAFEDQLKAAEEARVAARGATNMHAALKDNMQGLENEFESTRQENTELLARHAALRQENDTLRSQFARAKAEIESAGRDIEQRVIAALRKRQMLLVGMGAAAGLMVGGVGGWLAHRPSPSVHQKTDALVMQIETCLQNGEWVCANNAASGLLVLDSDNAVALAAQREVQVALAQADKERRLTAEAARLAAAARAQRTPPRQEQPVCPTVTTPPPAASNDAIRAAILQQHKQFGSMLISAAGNQLARGGLDCAVALASNAKNYDANNITEADRIIGQAQQLIRQGQAGVRVEDCKR